MATENKSAARVAQGLLEYSEPKYDLPKIRVGPFAFTPNLQHPSLHRHVRIKTTIVVIIAFALAFSAKMAWDASVGMKGRGIRALSSGLLQFALYASPFLAVYAHWNLGGRRRETRLLADLRALNSLRDDAPRIQVRGRPSELLEMAGLQDALFEPVILRASHRMIGMSLTIRVMLTMLLLGLVGWCALNLASGLKWWGFGIGASAGSYLCVKGIPDTPTYYRFVPGRLDVFWFAWVSTRKPEVQSIDLRTVPIRIDLTSRKDMILIDQPDNPIALRRDNLPEPLAFAVALVRAAICTAEAPPLPMDALVG